MPTTRRARISIRSEPSPGIVGSAERTPGPAFRTGSVPELASWAGRHDVELLRTIDRPEPGWTGPVGFVTEPLAGLALDPERTRAFLCGPEPMLRFGAEALLTKGIAAKDIRVSLERNMQCGIGWCGHCQLGPLLLCRDGPVVGYDVARPLLAVKEL